MTAEHATLEGQDHSDLEALLVTLGDDDKFIFS